MIADVWSLVAVVLIDLALSADNAVAVGLAAAALPEQERARAIGVGVLFALLLRILFGVGTVELLRIHGLLLLGGLLLFWIAYRMWRDLRVQGHVTGEASPTAAAAIKTPHTSFGRVLFSIVVANIALSLDNVLAVAGVSRHAPTIMVFGLILSVLLMGVAASLIARIIDKNRWIAVLGVIAIIFAGVVMIWDDLHAFFPSYINDPPAWLGGRTGPV
ncbi:MAG TPA: YjbE family putative metal transport protein [Caulobacterales bacterium]|nr:YjbE family putative metal transport protein [Caulobacterales bacterium]